MKETQIGIPHLFICPISLDLFRDPVTLCTGQTYDRSSIEKWLAAGNLTCPVTMQKLHDRTVVPNHTLRHLIDQWVQMGPAFDPQYLAKIDSLASIKHDLESNEEGFLTDKLSIVRKLRAQLEELQFGHSCFLQLGFFPLLLNLVFGEKESKISEECLTLVELSLSCILRLMSLGESEPLNILKDTSKIESFLSLFENGTDAIKKNLCQILMAISSSPETRPLCTTLGENHRLLHKVISIIHCDSDLFDAGIKVISALCSLEANRKNLIEAGAIDELIAFISTSEKHKRSSAPTAMASIEKLLGQERAKWEVIENPNGIRALVEMVFRVSDHEGSESAIDALMIVCRDSLRGREAAITAGVVTQLLLLLQSQCSGRTKSKARMLMKMLSSK